MNSHPLALRQAPHEEHLYAPFPWSGWLALVIGLIAQFLLEPPTRNYRLAIPLYILAAALTLWTALRDEWQLPALPSHRRASDLFTIHPFPLLLSIPFALAAFWGFGGGKFTVINISLWIAALALLIYGLFLKSALKETQLEDDQERIRRAIWLTLAIAVFGFTAFFRFNQIDSVPGQPFSDHAEKILDVYDISKGETKIFFERNTGRESLQMYWTLLVANLLDTGFSFLSLKLGTVLLGILTLPYIYLLGKEYATPRAGLFAMFLFGIAYWPNVISRMGLRFPLYPLFLAPTLLYLTRGLRTGSRNDLILCGLFLGLGLQGYSPFRIVPFLVVIAFALYLMHFVGRIARAGCSATNRPHIRQVLWWLTIVAIVSLFVFLPLLRYALDHYDRFAFRAFSRIGNLEAGITTEFWPILASNLLKGLLMFNWDNGSIWVNSIPGRPALDVVTGALFVLGLVLVAARYGRQLDWRDLFLLVSIPVLLMPSVLAIAFPAENPALNRAGGAAVIAILISALALDGLVTAIGVEKKRAFIAYGLTGLLMVASTFQNYDLVFRQFNESYLRGVWNTSEMGDVIQEFEDTYGQTDTVWIVPSWQWVDTRLPGMWIGIPDRDFALWPDEFAQTADIDGPKLFIFHPEDTETENALKLLYPDAELSRYTLLIPGKDFMVLFVEE